MSGPYNSIYDTYDTSGTITFFQLVNNEIIKLFNTNNVNKTYTLSNIYKYKKYKAINEILYILILLLTILNKNIEYFDNIAYGILVGVIIAVGFIYIAQKIIDILFRNNLNYDEYEFNYNKPEKMYIYKNIPFSTSDNTNKCNKK